VRHLAEFFKTFNKIKYPILVFYADSDSVNNSYQSRSLFVNFIIVIDWYVLFVLCQVKTTSGEGKPTMLTILPAGAKLHGQQVRLQNNRQQPLTLTFLNTSTNETGTFIF